MKRWLIVHHKLSPVLALIVGPLAWAINTQLGQVLPYLECGSALRPSAALSFLGAAVSVAAAVASWSSREEAGANAPSPSSGAPMSFVAMLGSLMALVFALALVLQGLSSLMLTGCER